MQEPAAGTRGAAACTTAAGHTGGVLRWGTEREAQGRYGQAVLQVQGQAMNAAASRDASARRQGAHVGESLAQAETAASPGAAVSPRLPTSSPSTRAHLKHNIAHVGIAHAGVAGADRGDIHRPPAIACRQTAVPGCSLRAGWADVRMGREGLVKQWTWVKHHRVVPAALASNSMGARCSGHEKRWEPTRGWLQGQMTACLSEKPRCRPLPRTRLLSELPHSRLGRRLPRIHQPRRQLRGATHSKEYGEQPRAG